MLLDSDFPLIPPWVLVLSCATVDECKPTPEMLEAAVLDFADRLGSTHGRTDDVARELIAFEEALWQEPATMERIQDLAERIRDVANELERMSVLRSMPAREMPMD